MLKRSKQRLTGWLAIAVLLLSALVPSVAQAVSAFGGESQQWQRICTAHGEELVQAEGDSGIQGQNKSLNHAGHCAFCLLSCLDWAPPHSIVPASIGSSGRYVPFVASDFPVFRRHPWSSPHSRAPPVYS